MIVIIYWIFVYFLIAEWYPVYDESDSFYLFFWKYIFLYGCSFFWTPYVLSDFLDIRVWFEKDVLAGFFFELVFGVSYIWWRFDWRELLTFVLFYITGYLDGLSIYFGIDTVLELINLPYSNIPLLTNFPLYQSYPFPFWIPSFHYPR